jgi:hypothetical protein
MQPDQKAKLLALAFGQEVLDMGGLCVVDARHPFYEEIVQSCKRFGLPVQELQPSDDEPFSPAQYADGCSSHDGSIYGEPPKKAYSLDELRYLASLDIRSRPNVTGQEVLRLKSSKEANGG